MYLIHKKHYNTTLYAITLLQLYYIILLVTVLQFQLQLLQLNMLLIHSHYIKFIIPLYTIIPNAAIFITNNPTAIVPNVYFAIVS